MDGASDPTSSIEGREQPTHGHSVTLITTDEPASGTAPGPRSALILFHRILAGCEHVFCNETNSRRDGELTTDERALGGAAAVGRQATSLVRHDEEPTRPKRLAREWK